MGTLLSDFRDHASLPVEPSWSWFDQRDVRFFLTWRKKTRNCRGNHNTFSEIAVWHHIVQCQKLCPAFSCEGPFCQYVCQLLGCVDVIDLNRWVQVDAVTEPVQNHSLSPWHVSHRRASSFCWRTASLSSKMYNVACLLKVVRWVECGRCCWTDSALWLAVLNAMLAKGFSSPLGVTLQHVSHKNMHGDTFHTWTSIQDKNSDSVRPADTTVCFLLTHDIGTNVGAKNYTEHGLTRTWNLNSCKIRILGWTRSTINCLVTHMTVLLISCVWNLKVLQAFCRMLCSHFVTGRAEVFTVHNRSGRPIRERIEACQYNPKACLW